VVEQGAIERFGRTGKAACHYAVGLAGARIPAWMIVGEDNSRAVVEGCVGNDRSDRKLGSVFVALVPGQVETVRVIIEVSDPETLSCRIRIREAPREESACRTKPVELERQIGTLMTHGRNLGRRGYRNEQNRIRCGS